MADLVASLASVATCGVILWSLVRVACRVRQRGGGGSLMQPFDEIWNPAAYQACVEVEVQQERPAPRLVPGNRLI